MNTLYGFDDIDDYLHERMSAPDREAFEAAMASNPDLAQRVDALRAEAVVLRHLRREALLDRLAELDQTKVISQTLQTKAPARRRWIGPAVAAAAAVALLVWALSSYGIFRSGQDSPPLADKPTTVQPGQHENSISTVPPQTTTSAPEKPDSTYRNNGSLKPASPTHDLRYSQLAAQHFKPDYSGINLMGNGTPSQTQDTLQLAARAIAQNAYGKAEKLLKQIPSSRQDDFTTAQILLGDIYFAQNKFDFAEKAYSRPAQSTKDKFCDLAQWRLVLVFLAQYPDKKGAFNNQMARILDDPDHSFYRKAKALTLEVEQLDKK